MHGNKIVCSVVKAKSDGHQLQGTKLIAEYGAAQASRQEQLRSQATMNMKDSER